MDGQRNFPDTRASLVHALASTEYTVQRNAFDLVVRAYRTPVIALLERRWNLAYHDAEDLAHEFFAAALEKHWLARFDGERGRFRTFLRSCLFAFAATVHEREGRQKRGGTFQHVSLDDHTPDPGTEAELDAMFQHEWVRSVLNIALEALRSEAQTSSRREAVLLFEQYDVDGSDAETRPSYAELAAKHNVPVTQVTNHLSWARKHFRQHVLNTVRALTGSEEEYQAEVRALLPAPSA